MTTLKNAGLANLPKVHLKSVKGQNVPFQITEDSH
jgi:hypothetical protein